MKHLKKYHQDTVPMFLRDFILKHDNFMEHILSEYDPAKLNSHQIHLKKFILAQYEEIKNAVILDSYYKNSVIDFTLFKDKAIMYGIRGIGDVTSLKTIESSKIDKYDIKAFRDYFEKKSYVEKKFSKKTKPNFNDPIMAFSKKILDLNELSEELKHVESFIMNPKLINSSKLLNVTKKTGLLD